MVDIRNWKSQHGQHLLSVYPHNLVQQAFLAERCFTWAFFNAGWHDEWLSLLVTVGTATQKRRHQYASVITDEVLSIYLFFSSFLPFSLFPPSTFTPCRFSAFNQFPCSISKHVLCVTVRAFLTLSTLSEAAHALVIDRRMWPIYTLYFFMVF